MNIEEINAEFQGLIDRIKRCAAQLTNLDLLRIQLVYDNHNAEGEVPIQDFMATAWSKLAVYHAVCIQIKANAYLPWKEAPNGQVKNGDYLIKMPDNKSIYIPGNKTYFYQPTSYDTQNGQLNFDLVTDSSQTSATVSMPQWSQGSNVGRVWTGEIGSNLKFTVTPINGVSNVTTTVRSSGRFFTDEQEEIIYPASSITVSISGASATVELPSQSPAASYYIPYYIQQVNG